MDWMGFDFTTAAVVEALAAGIGAGATAGVLFVLVTLFYGRRAG